MEKPDADGYINVKWPSKTIPHGGIFHTRVGEPSPAKSEFLKGVVIRLLHFHKVRVDCGGTKLPITVRRLSILYKARTQGCEINQACSNLSGIRCRCGKRNIPRGFRSGFASSSSVRGLIEESKLAARLRQKDAYNLRQGEEKLKKTIAYQVPIVRPRTSRRRSLSVIRESGAYETSSYRPLQRGEDRERQKDKLANAMAYGDCDEQLLKVQGTKIKEKKSPPKLPTKKETWHDLMTQIRERAEWLAEMEYLGQGMQHREVIEDQIAERMRALEALGIDNQCTSARSTIPAIETKKVVENTSVGSNTSKRSGTSHHFKGLQRNSPSGKNKLCVSKNKEENVMAYKDCPPLEYSPRRRV